MAMERYEKQRQLAAHAAEHGWTNYTGRGVRYDEMRLNHSSGAVLNLKMSDKGTVTTGSLTLPGKNGGSTTLPLNSKEFYRITLVTLYQDKTRPQRLELALTDLKGVKARLKIAEKELREESERRDAERAERIAAEMQPVPVQDLYEFKTLGWRLSDLGKKIDQTNGTTDVVSLVTEVEKLVAELREQLTD